MLKLLAAAAVLAAFALLPAPARAAAARPPMKSCGDFEGAGGFLFGDLVARRVTCRNARRTARRVPVKCGIDTSSCTVRRFSCVVARAAPELRLVHCNKPRGGSPVFKAIHFEFGS